VLGLREAFVELGELPYLELSKYLKIKTAG